MIATKPEEIETLRAAGKALAEVLGELVRLVRAGITTASLDLAAERAVHERGAVPVFLGYSPDGAAYPYPAASCVSVNDEVVHGIPREERVLQAGDIVSLDLGLSYKGFFVDSATTVCAGVCDAKGQRLINATREALMAAIEAARVGGSVGDIGAAVERVATKYKLAIVEELGGHAVGRAVHEKPFIPNEGRAGEGPELMEGLVLAIEPMLAEGGGAIVLAEDKWTYRMRDGKRAAHFEHTVLLTKEGPEILTLAE